MSADYFQTYNRYLVGLAYRMLGSVQDAEEVTQEAFLRHQAAGAPELRDPRAWFSRVCTRLCLDRMKRLSSKLENYPGEWLPEPFVEPIDRVAMDETLSIALLLGLKELGSAERAVFLLHDIFDFRYEEIAETLELTDSNCRQLAVRARKRLREARGNRRSDPRQVERITDAFLRAVRDSDAGALQAVLAEDVKLTSDGGGKVVAVPYPLRGRKKVQTFLLRIFAAAGPGTAIRATTRWFNGAPGLIIQADGHPPSAFQLDVLDDQVASIFVQRNPDKLGRLLEFRSGQTRGLAADEPLPGWG